MISLDTEAAIWERVIHPDGELTPKAARAILKLTFRTHDRKRMRILAVKAQHGRLTPDEEAAIENYERVGTMLSILKSRARKLLKRAPTRRP